MPPKKPPKKPPPAKSKAKPTPPARGRKPPPVPANWPPSLVYLTRPHIARLLPASTASALGLSPAAASTSPASAPCGLVRIRAITAPSHPARGQHGLFAAQRLAARSFVLDYLGVVHGAADEDAASDYDLCLDRELAVGVDARRMGNEARFVNDFRGVAARANVEFGVRRVGAGAGEARMGLWVGPRDVAKGEELLVSYGKGFWSGRAVAEETPPDVQS